MISFSKEGLILKWIIYNIFEGYLKLWSIILNPETYNNQSRKTHALGRKAWLFPGKVNLNKICSYFIESNILNVIVYIVFSREPQMYSFEEEKVFHSPSNFSF